MCSKDYSRKSTPLPGGQELLPSPLSMVVGGDREKWAQPEPGYFDVYPEVDDMVWVIISECVQCLWTELHFC